MCVSPINVKVRQGMPDERIERVPCGRCFQCRKVKVDDWTTRMMIEANQHLYNYFLTLTYNDDHVPFKGNCFTLVKSDLQNYFKRLRKQGFVFRYFATGEYGSHTFRPHYHVIVFSDKAIDITDFEKAWTLDNIVIGFVKLGSVTPNSIAYVAKYHIFGFDLPESMVKPFNVMSRRPGIGSVYKDDKQWQQWHQDSPEKRFYTIIDGVKRFLPKYVRKSIFTDSQRHRVAEHFDKTIPEKIEFQKKLPTLMYTKNLYDKLHQKKDI